MVAAEPDNPYAYLDLAASYWDENMFGEAEDAYGAALERAGNDPEFYVRAGDIALERELWTEAAQMYLEAARLMRTSAPPELQDRMRQALYLASGDPDADEMLEDLHGSRVPPDLVAVLQARQALEQGQIVRAKMLVRRLNERSPGLGELKGELKLLEAEILIAEGQEEQAVDELVALLSDPVTPQWIRFVADYIIREIPSGE
jgi:hypothetical protein